MSTRHPDTFTFIHVSDLHFLKNYETYTGAFREVFLKMNSPLKQLDLLLQQIDEMPSFVLLGGDLCHEGEEEDYKMLRESLDIRFPGLPLYAVPGNHDKPNAFNNVFGMREKRVHDIDLDGLRLILLDNTNPRSQSGLITEKDADELKFRLYKSRTPAILLTHHHLIKDQFVLPSAAYPKSLLTIFSGSPLRAILTGHTHHVYKGFFAGVPVYNSGSLCFRGNNGSKSVLMDEYPAIQLCRFTKGELSVIPLISPHPPRLLCGMTLQQLSN